ncbi:MAG: hypothetical protein JNL83_32320 [Myxococcales bacterium]|nr:hypothetical protein [Myxococcales bacterium]
MTTARDPLSRSEVLALPSVANLDELRQCLYNHIMDAIDWGRIYGYEQMLWSLLPALGQQGDVDELAEKLIGECLARAAFDPMRLVSNVPPGITDAERRAVEYDDGCVFCRADAASGADQRQEHDDDDDDCPLCTDMAAEWRDQHQAVLKKAGLWRPPPS